MQADSGGLVSPGGISYIGRSHEQLGEIPAAIAIKRCLRLLPVLSSRSTNSNLIPNAYANQFHFLGCFSMRRLLAGARRLVPT
jgi:hypothetical protein